MVLMQGVMAFVMAVFAAEGSVGKFSHVKPNLGKVGENTVNNAAPQESQASAEGGLLRPAVEKK